MTMQITENIQKGFNLIDQMIRTWDEASQTPSPNPQEAKIIQSLKCPDNQRKSYYLKCCHLLYVYQTIKRYSPLNKEDTELKISFLKQMLPILRDAKF